MEKVELKFLSISPESHKSGAFTVVFGDKDCNPLELTVDVDQAKDIYEGLYGLKGALSDVLESFNEVTKQAQISLKEVVIDHSADKHVKATVIGEPKNGNTDLAKVMVMCPCPTISLAIAFANEYKLPIYTTKQVMEYVPPGAIAGHLVPKKYQEENHKSLKKILQDIEIKAAAEEKYELAANIRDKVKQM